MKQALVVDEIGTVGYFAAAALDAREYQLTVVATLQEALALVTAAPYQVVLIAKPHVCPEALWHMVESIKAACSDTTLLLVQAADADAAFHERAREASAVVLSSPLGVAAETELLEALPG
jgi:CheY-like chemotaxis protein